MNALTSGLTPSLDIDEVRVHDAPLRGDGGSLVAHAPASVPDRGPSPRAGGLALVPGREPQPISSSMPEARAAVSSPRHPLASPAPAPANATEAPALEWSSALDQEFRRFEVEQSSEPGPAEGPR